MQPCHLKISWDWHINPLKDKVYSLEKMGSAQANQVGVIAYFKQTKQNKKKMPFSFKCNIHLCLFWGRKNYCLLDSMQEVYFILAFNLGQQY